MEVSQEYPMVSIVRIQRGGGFLLGKIPMKLIRWIWRYPHDLEKSYENEMGITMENIGNNNWDMGITIPGYSHCFLNFQHLGRTSRNGKLKHMRNNRLLRLAYVEKIG